MRPITRAGVVVLLIAAQAVAVAGQDALDNARRLYNEGRFDEALAAASMVWEGSQSDAAAVVLARARLERYRAGGPRSDLTAAHDLLRQIDAGSLLPMERAEWELGVAAELYLRDEFGPAAEILEPLLRANIVTGTDRDRLIDWWASAVSHTARDRRRHERIHLFEELTQRLELELAQDPALAAATYWLVEAARGAGDLERAWNLAVAGWIRAGAGHDALRSDLDRLVLRGVIPDLAVSRTSRPPSDDVTIDQMAQLVDSWEAVKARWAFR